VKITHSPLTTVTVPMEASLRCSHSVNQDDFAFPMGPRRRRLSWRRWNSG
jgi:hypothetical protein